MCGNSSDHKLRANTITKGFVPAVGFSGIPVSLHGGFVGGGRRAERGAGRVLARRTLIKCGYLQDCNCGRRTTNINYWTEAGPHHNSHYGAPPAPLHSNIVPLTSSRALSAGDDGKGAFTCRKLFTGDRSRGF